MIVMKAKWLVLAIAVACMLLACGESGSSPILSSLTTRAAPTSTPAPPPRVLYIGPDRNLWAIIIDGREKRWLTTDGANSSPRWSPDGRQIAFIHSFGSGRAEGRQVEVMNVDGSNRRVVLPPVHQAIMAEYMAGMGNVRWSADGCALYVHVALGPVGMHPVYAVPLCGGSQSQAGVVNTFDVRADGVFAWTFSGGGVGNDLRIGGLEDRDAIRVDGNGPLAWSPDGSLVALQESGDIRILSETGRPFSRYATASDGSTEGLDWSSDGESIVYGVSDEIYVLSLESGESRFLAQGTEPDWSPE